MHARYLIDISRSVLRTALHPEQTLDAAYKFRIAVVGLTVMAGAYESHDPVHNESVSDDLSALFNNICVSESTVTAPPDRAACSVDRHEHGDRTLSCF